MRLHCGKLLIVSENICSDYLDEGHSPMVGAEQTVECSLQVFVLFERAAEP